MTSRTDTFLVALRGYREQFQRIQCPADLEAVKQLDFARLDIDWKAVDFVITALKEGSEIFAVHPSTGAVTQYDAPEPPSPDQQELPFS